MEKYTVIDELTEMLHVRSYKCLTQMHDYSLVSHRVAWQAHRMMVTRRCVLPAGWPLLRASFQPGSFPL
jgi:hypothetical protein